jgi:hypothetical protein
VQLRRNLGKKNCELSVNNKRAILRVSRKSGRKREIQDFSSMWPSVLEGDGERTLAFPLTPVRPAGTFEKICT